jgi:hypothetical protein
MAGTVDPGDWETVEGGSAENDPGDWETVPSDSAATFVEMATQGPVERAARGVGRAVNPMPLIEMGMDFHQAGEEGGATGIREFDQPVARAKMLAKLAGAEGSRIWGELKRAKKGLDESGTPFNEETMTSGLSAVPLVGGAVRSIRDRAMEGDVAGALGESAGSVLPLPSSKFRAATAAKAAQRVRRSRAKNIARAADVSDDVISKLEGPGVVEGKYIKGTEDLVDLPIAVTRRHMRDRMAKQLEREQNLLDVEKGKLSPEADIPVEMVTERIDEVVPGGDPALARALEKTKKEIEGIVPDAPELYGPDDKLLPAGPKLVSEQQLQKVKEARDAAAHRGGAHRKAELGEPRGVQSEADLQAANAGRGVMGDVRPDLDTQNKIFSAVKSVKDGLNSRVLNDVKTPFISRQLQALTGRALAGSAAAGGAGFMLGAGALTTTAGGAIGVLALAGMMNTPLWHGLSAATKRSVVRAIESGNLAKAQTAFELGVVSASRRKTQADQEVEDTNTQGEGVVEP